MKRATKRRIKRHLLNFAGILYVIVGVITTVLITFVNDLLGKLVVLAIGLVLGAIGYYVDAIRGKRTKTKDQLRPLIEEFFLPRVVAKYKDSHPENSPPDVRTNIMLLERRDFPLPTGERKLFPWKRSMTVDFNYGDYNDESHLKWGVDEGVCGTAIEYNKALDSDLEDVEIHEWDMTEKQLRATQHLGSVLSIPIYRPSDEEKDNPVGVLNLDSQENLSDTRFDDSKMKQDLKKYASYVGRTL
jgi:hypothetical protein